MLTLELIAGVWVVCGLVAFLLSRHRRRYAAGDAGTTVIQVTACVLLGAIALFAALTNDD